MNHSDTERVAAVLESFGYKEVENIDDASVVIFNTCSIKQKAEDKVFSLINNIHKKRMKSGQKVTICVTGCMVQKTSSQESEEKDPLLPRIPAIDIVFRILETQKLPTLLGEKRDSSEKQDFFSIIPKYASPFQAIVPIQSGCDNFCTFCVVPFTRGREFSRPMDQVVKEISVLAKRGVKEVCLVGQNVNSYGKGLESTQRIFDEENKKWLEGEGKTPFTLLLEAVNSIEGIERIRFQSSNPHDMTSDVIDAICDLPKVMPALHFALQSGSDEVLKKMNRRHSYADYKSIVDTIRNKVPDFAITTDIIVGFCGETEEAFQETVAILPELDLDMIYLSQYSVRPGTVAGKHFIDEISAAEKKNRWNIVNDWLIEAIAKKMKSLIGNTYMVLIDSEIEDGLFEGKTEHNRRCRIRTQKSMQLGDILSVKIIGSSQWALEGEI